MDKRICCVAVLMIGSVSVFGCSKKTDTSTPDAGGGGTGTGTAGTSVTAGAGGSAGRGTGGMGTAVAMNFPCGDTKCAGSAPNPNMMMIPGFMIAQACCADDATSTCGTVQSSTMMCAPPPTPAPKCPKTFGNFAGCCAGDNLCGADLSLGGMGCIELGKFKMMIPAAAQGFLMLPAAAYCDTGLPVPVPDAGMVKDNDAGQ